MYILGSYDYPRRKGSAGTLAGDAGLADPPYPDLQSPARAGNRPCHPANVPRRTARRARRALSGASALGIAGLDFRRMGDFQEQPQGAFLSADREWSQTACQRGGEVEPLG